MEPQQAQPLQARVMQESWCYKTLARIDCYTQPQNLPPESLVSVDPPERFPTSRDGYARILAETTEAGK